MFQTSLFFAFFFPFSNFVKVQVYFRKQKNCSKNKLLPKDADLLIREKNRESHLLNIILD